MEQIKILFFALASFFGIENGRIASDKTTITIHPQDKEIEIIQEGLFTVIQTEEDKTITLKQWNKIVDAEEKHTLIWSKELKEFPVKKFNFTFNSKTIQPHITLKYTKEKDLRVLGIWYNEEKNEFSINNIPQNNIKTEDGKLEGNYWIFNSENTITFTIEPFLQMPEKYREFKKPLIELLEANK
ncbi:hypothetical protein INR76_08035 [Marixanthomonas sp. SCSIO 43207]|uniref:hypothetical protein n=1 Tax=Marixanthomonas sp. SCSIO 43207 TaxID=2779360 RepID=UPI001CA8C6AB|nr:hypothetical protein [Marixanthomonas sp. SCSIO 43207]UAB80083.1 hypothetical protein INR76_08035 [Marixanthomonas sp. SCSIO 43207]